MQLPAFFGHKKSVNLLPRDSFETSPVGVVLEWALVFGKWSVIATQLVVMCVFLWRFALDRQLTDLRREMAQSAAVIESYADTEEKFLLLQRQAAYAKDVLERQALYTQLLTTSESSTPSDVWYERMTLSTDNLGLVAYSSSLSGFGGLLSNLQQNSAFDSVNIGTIEDGGVKGARLKFDITLGIREQSK